jgi:hypothetical protein
MAQKELLLIDLSARLPYDPIVYVDENLPRLKLGAATRVWEYIAVDKPCKPYLRPMSSMTREERCEIQGIIGKDVEILDDFINIVDSSRKRFSFLELQAVYDWLNKKMFDYRGLIDKGLALEAPEDMYK